MKCARKLRGSKVFLWYILQEELKISSDGDIISDILREGNDLVDCSFFSFTICVYSQFNSLKNSNANCNLHMRCFSVITPLNNDKNVKYYLIQCIEGKMKLLEDYNDNGCTYERGSIILKGFFSADPYD